MCRGGSVGGEWCVNVFSVPDRGARACCCDRECRNQGQRRSYRDPTWACKLQHPTVVPALQIAHDTPVPPPRPLAMQAFAITAMMCRCKNSRCLKKYCDCFAVSERQRQTGVVGARIGRCRRVWDSRYCQGFWDWRATGSSMKDWLCGCLKKMAMSVRSKRDVDASPSLMHSIKAAEDGE